MLPARLSRLATVPLGVILLTGAALVPVNARELPTAPEGAAPGAAAGEEAQDRADTVEAVRDADEEAQDRRQAATDGAAGATERAARADARQTRSREREQRTDRRKLRSVQILGFNDLHGHLAPPTGSAGRVVVGHTVDTAGRVSDATVEAGGAAYLATHLNRLRDGQRASFTLAAGDQIGASPLLSAAFRDEPTMEVLDRIGLDAGVVGNHEFDQGYEELLRMVDGGCRVKKDGTPDDRSCPAHPYEGVGFPLLAANVYHEGTRDTILPPYTVLSRGGVRIGVVGVVLKDTAKIVTRSGIEGLEFGDEVEAIDRAAGQLRRKGVNAVIALVHQGADLTKQPWTAPDGKTYPANPAYDASCKDGRTDLLTGSPVLPIVQKASAAVDAFLTAHSHQAYVCQVKDPAGNPRLVTQALSFGRLVTDLRLAYDPRTRDIVRSRSWARQQVVGRDVPPDPAVSKLIAEYSTLVRPIAARPVGRITADVTAARTPAGESALGDLVADAQLAAASGDAQSKPVIAFMNPGGIRADLVHAPTAGEAPGVVTYGEAFAVQPFNNYLVSMTLTGAQLYDLLGQQFAGANAASPRILQVSNGFSYRWSGSAVVAGSVTLNGVPVDRAKSYRVVANSFLADGGDGFSVFTKATGKVVGGLDIDAFVDYLQKHQPYAPGPVNRIVRS